jgi:hypothetical protein
MRTFKLHLVAWLFACPGIAGCQNIAPPDFGHPGRLRDQQYNAHRFDPFPDTAAPGAADIRPREYDRPPPEPSRARWTRAAPWQQPPAWQYP